MFRCASIIFILSTCYIQSCDYDKNKYVPYTNSKSSCQAGIDSFDTNITSSIANCSCHSATNPILSATADPSENRTAILGAESSYAYLSSASHQGSSYFSPDGLSEEKWNTWQQAESECE